MPIPGKKMFKVLTPIERKDGTTFWLRLGAGFHNKDESINVYLDAYPANLKLQIREMTDEDFKKDAPRDGGTRIGPVATASMARDGGGRGSRKSELEGGGKPDEGDDLPF